MYLEPTYSKERAIIEKAIGGDAESEKLLTGLAAEAIRECKPMVHVFVSPF